MAEGKVGKPPPSYKAQQGEGGEGQASADGAHDASHGEDVVDAEFEEVDGDDHKKSA